MEHIFLIGRMLLGGYFIFAGMNHLVHLSELSKAAKLRGIFAAPLFVFLTGLVILIAGGGIFFWIYPGTAALLLAAFLLLASLVMHPFWLFRNAAPEIRTTEMRFFLSNLALAGGLMILATRLTEFL